MSRSFASASSQYLEVNTAALTAVPVTMSCWFYPLNVTDNMVLMGLFDSSQPDQWFMVEAQGAGGDQISAFARQGTVAQAITTNTFTANTWHHAAAVFQSATQRYSYLNGDTANRGSDTTNVTPSGLNRTSIGRAGDSTPIAYMNGRIAEVAFWDVALTSDEISALSRGVSPLLVRPGNLVLYVPLVRDNDRDLVGGLTFTPTAAPTVGDHPRVFKPKRRSFVFASGAAGPTLITSSDAISFSVADSVSNLLSTSSSTDTVSFSIAENTPLVDVVLSAVDAISLAISDLSVDSTLSTTTGDTLSMAINDLAQILSTSSSTDTVSFSINDVAAIASTIASSDTVSIAVADAVATLIPAILASDTLSISINDAVSAMFGVVTSSDAIGISINDVASIFATLNSTDTISLSINDVANVAALITALDTISFSINEQSIAIAAGEVAAKLRAYLRAYAAIDGDINSYSNLNGEIKVH